jgi:hypothetical protein
MTDDTRDSDSLRQCVAFVCCKGLGPTYWVPPEQAWQFYHLVILRHQQTDRPVDALAAAGFFSRYRWTGHSADYRVIAEVRFNKETAFLYTDPQAGHSDHRLGPEAGTREFWQAVVDAHTLRTLT